jgi:hypothetical protein
MTNWTRRFLERARVTDDPVGDLIADMRRGPGIPELFPNLPSFRSYLRGRGVAQNSRYAAPAGLTSCSPSWAMAGAASPPPATCTVGTAKWMPFSSKACLMRA